MYRHVLEADRGSSPLSAPEICLMNLSSSAMLTARPTIGALRDGGLPSVSEALRIPVKDGGFIRRGGVPLGGGDAVEAFLNGVKEGEKVKEGEDKTDTE